MYYPRPPSKYRVIILDEAEYISKQGQASLRKYFEDGPARSSVWIICTTEPDKIDLALQRRCKKLNLRPMQPEDVKKLVESGMKKSGSIKPVEPLLDELEKRNLR